MQLKSGLLLALLFATGCIGKRTFQPIQPAELVYVRNDGDWIKGIQTNGRQCAVWVEWKKSERHYQSRTVFDHIGEKEWVNDSGKTRIFESKFGDNSPWQWHMLWHIQGWDHVRKEKLDSSSKILNMVMVRYKMHPDPREVDCPLEIFVDEKTGFVLREVYPTYSVECVSLKLGIPQGDLLMPPEGWPNKALQPTPLAAEWLAKEKGFWRRG